MPRTLLVSLRDPGDPMAAHERMCFAEAARLSEDDVSLHPMMGGRPHRDQLTGVDAVFFGGSGAYSVLDDTAWIREAIEVMLEVIDLGVPSYASCFGFQGLALALGGEVINDEARMEMGSTRVHLTPAGLADPLFKHLPPSPWVQQGHHDRVSRLPPGVDLLVAGDVCYEQAFRVTGKPFWASQFHPELDRRRTLDRFHHYRSFYLEEADAEARLAQLMQGEETAEVRELLARVARHDF
jgi:GMP synthase (glutamine-hydrolysing)